MFTQKEIKMFIKSFRSDSGSFKVFVKLNNRLGIKIAQTESVRDHNYDKQELASLVDLGPKVYGKFEITVNHKNEDITLYGYYTEVVEVFECDDDFYKRFEREDLINLRDDLEMRTGFHNYDVRWCNVGIKNGKLVCIDFDHDNVYNESNSQEIFWLLQNV
jgi:hypothetical protein